MSENEEGNEEFKNEINEEESSEVRMRELENSMRKVSWKVDGCETKG